MKNRGYPIDSNVKVNCVLAATLSDAQIDAPMHTTSLRDGITNYGGDAKIMLTIPENNIEGLIGEEISCIHAENTQTKAQL